MQFDSFIKELKAVPGLESLKSDQKGVYSLRINHAHLVYFSESFSRTDLYIYAPVCHIPSDTQEKLYLFDQLLTANLFGQDSANGWFGCDKNSHDVFLMVRIPRALLTLDLFTSELQQFISCLSHWKTSIADFSKKPKGKPQPVHSTSYIKP